MVKDENCWACHRCGNQVFCNECGLGFHLLCAKAWKEGVKIEGYKSTLKRCRQCLKLKKSKELHTMASWSRRFPVISRKKLNETLIAILTEGIDVQVNIMLDFSFYFPFLYSLRFKFLSATSENYENPERRGAI